MSRREEQNRSRGALLAATSKGLELLKQGPAPPPPLPPPIGCYLAGGGGCAGAGAGAGCAGGEPAPCERQLAAQSKRKEKARIAARARRGQEASIIMDMAMELHISQDKLRRIDKATIIKLGIDYIKAYEVLCRVKPVDAGAIVHQQQAEQLQQERQQRQQEQHQQHQRQHYYHIDRLREKRQKHEDQYREREQVHIVQVEERDQEQVPQPQPLPPPLYSAPKLSTASIFAPKTSDNCNEHFLMIEEKANGKPLFVLKPDTEILEEDDLTHLAPQAGDSTSISFETDPLDGIPFDDLLTTC